MIVDQEQPQSENQNIQEFFSLKNIFLTLQNSGIQPCQNVPAASNFTTFSPFIAAYSTLDFTRSPLAGKGPGVCCLLLLLCCLLLQNILTGLRILEACTTPDIQYLDNTWTNQQ